MNAPYQLDSRSVRRWFDKASHTYAAAARLQQQTREELLARLEYFSLTPDCVLDLGAGLGEGAEKLRQRFPRAQVIAVDLATAMLRRGVGRRFWRRPPAVCADVRQLPLAAGTVDLAFSNLMLQWCALPLQAFTEIARVLKPGGLLLASTFGPLTLQELRSAWASVDSAPHVGQFPDLPELAGQLSAAGFHEPVLDVDQQVRHYPQAANLHHELQALGARNAHSGRRRTLTGKARWLAMTTQYETLRADGGLPATWELIYMAAFAGQSPAFATTPGEHRVPAEGLRIRTRP